MAALASPRTLCDRGRLSRREGQECTRIGDFGPTGTGCGAVAQLGERLVRNEEVWGSIPHGSTTRFRRLNGHFCDFLGTLAVREIGYSSSSSSSAKGLKTSFGTDFGAWLGRFVAGATPIADGAIATNNWEACRVSSLFSVSSGRGVLPQEARRHRTDLIPACEPT
jgi:hypothetical protein